MSFDKNYLKELVLNDKNFTKILKEASTVNLIYLSFNPTLTKEMINTLFEKNYLTYFIIFDPLIYLKI